VVRCVLVRLVLFLLFVSWATAQPSRFEGQRILDIQYDPQPPLDARDLAAAQPLKKGEALRLEDVGLAIDQLYSTGQFDDIQVQADAAPDGVVVRFLTKPRMFVGHVGSQGKIPQPPSRGQLTNGSQLNLGEPYDENALHAMESTLTRLFRANGLHEAQLNTRIDRDDQIQQLNFTFVVKAGKRAKYERPAITGNPQLPDETIIRATGWRFRFIGWYRQVTESLTRKGVSGVLNQYSNRDRLTATVRIADLAYNPQTRRVKPTLEVQAGPKVKIQAIEAKVSKRTLRKYVPVFEERRVDRDLLVEGARNLRDYFQSQGYYDVDVNYREREDGPDQRIIEYVVSRGQRFKLVKLDVRGNKYFNTETIRERMFLEAASFRFRHGRFSEAMRTKDQENIANLYLSNGFKDVKVTSTTNREYQGKAGSIAVEIRIVEGAQWFVDKVELTGVHQENREELMATLSSLPGQPYSDYNVAVDRTAVLTRYFSNGFPNATFRWRSSPSGQPNRVNLEYILDEGQRKYVRDVRISGLRVTRPSMVARSLTLKPDDPLSLNEMTGAQKNLYNLGIFAKVDTAVQNPDGNTQYKHVLYDIEEANRYTVNLGIGAEGGSIGGTTTNVTSPVGGTGFSPRVSLDVTRLNFLGLGHFVTVRGRWSRYEQLGSFNYVLPRFQNVDGRNITFTALYDLSNNVRTFTSKREEGSAQISQQFRKDLTGLFRLTYRRVSTSQIAIPSLLVPLLAQPVRLGLVSANIAQDRRDNAADAHRGIYNTADVTMASSILGSQRTFLRVLVRNATYHPVTHTWVFARQTTFGFIQPFNVPAGTSPDDYIPLPERFFGGGNISHRGFGENQAGPRDLGTPAGPGAQATQPTGFPLGGNAAFFNAFELRFPLIGDNIGGVLFHDMGNVYRSVGDVSFRASQRNPQDFNYMVHAVGAGIRYRTPIGPIRVDLAYSVNPPSFLGFQGTYTDLLQCNPSLPPSELPSQCQSVKQNTGHFQFFFSIGQTF
jgi:outer membrane protein insertion porin family